MSDLLYAEYCLLEEALPTMIRRVSYLFALGVTGCASLLGASSYQSTILGDEILVQCSRRVPKTFGTWQITLAQSRELEKALKEDRGNIASDLVLDDYSFQYAGVVIDGEKVVYINAFTNRQKIYQRNWQYSPVNVCGGGRLFWGALYDPGSKEFYEVSYNEQAYGLPPVNKDGSRKTI